MKAKAEFEEWYHSDECCIPLNANSLLAARSAWLAAKEKYEPRWVSCDGGLPDCIGSYLVFGSLSDPGCNDIAWAFFNSGSEWCDTQGYFTEGVTHWMPLPSAPSTQGEE